MGGKYPVCFLLPYLSTRPVGGYKVVYEYANRFARAGHDVTIAVPYVPSTKDYACTWIRHFIANPHHIRAYCAFRNKVRHCADWFKLDAAVRLMPVFQFSPVFALRFPRNTRFVATFVWTAYCLDQMPALKKYYFLQGREEWWQGLDRLNETYRLSLRKIAISEWIREGVNAAGADADIVPNGLDFEYFKLNVPIAERKPHEVAMLWHTDDRKRTEDAVAALSIVHAHHPELHVSAFGACDSPDDLPAWITFHHCPDRELHNRIYNTASIFVASSEQEGWGLCPCEAMICGCAVACTDIGGYREFAKNGKTALMSPARDVNALAANVLRLMEDGSFRCQVATAGNECIKRFTWESSFEKFRRILDA